MMTTLAEIVDVFEMLGDWELRYQYLVELGEQIAPMPEALKTDANKVKGCMSQVWVAAYPDQHDNRIWHFHGDCDTSIIKGVLALLIQLVDGKSRQQILELDVDEIFEKLQLYDHLSPNRHVGIYAIVALMKQQIAAIQQHAADISPLRASVP